MKLTHLRPMIWTDNLDKTITFYTDLLGFSCLEKNEEWSWASLRKDEVALMLAGPNAHNDYEGPQFTGSLYFNTDDVDTLWEKLKDRVKICYPIEEFEWNMREFAIYDNNGYILQFGQEMGG